MKYLKVRQNTARRIFNSLLRVSSGDETLRLMLGILRQKLKVILHTGNIHTAN